MDLAHSKAMDLIIPDVLLGLRLSQESVARWYSSQIRQYGPWFFRRPHRVGGREEAGVVREPKTIALGGYGEIICSETWALNSLLN